MLIFTVLCQQDSAGFGTQDCISIIICMKNSLVDYSPQQAALYSLPIPGVNKVETRTVGLANLQSN